MNELIYLGHPAQFHFFKYIIRNLQEHGHQVKVLLKTKDILEDLVKAERLEYENIQPVMRKNNPLAIATAQFQRTVTVMKRCKSFKPDVLIGTDASLAQAGKLLHIPTLTTLEDDAEVVPKLAKACYPFTTDILVPKVCGVGKWNPKKIGYDGYMKLAYLHPSYFIPDKKKAEKYVGEAPFALIRLASLTAHHDAGQKEIATSVVLKVIDKLKQKGIDSYISAEMNLPPELEPYRLHIDVENIHHVLLYASMLFSDSQSMSMEAAMLGVPSLRFSNFSGRISVLEELENNYGLTFGMKIAEPERLMSKLDELLALPDLREEFQQRRQTMLADKIDVTGFFTWFIENYPKSREIMRETPEYQYNFK